MLLGWPVCFFWNDFWGGPHDLLDVALANFLDIVGSILEVALDFFLKQFLDNIRDAFRV